SWARTTAHTGPTSNAPSPRPPPGGDAGSSSATAERPGTTPGSSAAPPLSTCATCSAAAWPATTAPGSWTLDRAGRPVLGAGQAPGGRPSAALAQPGSPRRLTGQGTAAGSG